MLIPILLLAAEANLDAIRQGMAAPMKGVSAIHLVAEREDLYSNGAAGTETYEYAAGGAGRVRLGLKTGNREGLLVSDGSTTWKALPKEKQWSKAEVALQPDDEDDKQEAAPGGREQPDLRLQITRALFGHGLSMSRLAAPALALKNEESIKVDGRKFDCWVLTGRLNDGQHTVWVDKNTHLVLQRKSSARVRAGNGVLGIETAVKVKTLKLNQEVATNTFAFTAPPKWTEAEFVLLPGEEGLSLANQPAVGFALKNLEGDTVSLNALQGKVVVLDFWATWCPPCRRTMPHLERLSTELKEQGVAVVGVSAEETGVVKSYIKKQNFTFPILLDAKREVNRRYGIRAIPTTLVIDRQGVIRSHFVGAPSEERLRQAVTAALR